MIREGWRVEAMGPGGLGMSLRLMILAFGGVWIGCAADGQRAGVAGESSGNEVASARAAMRSERRESRSYARN